MEKPELVYVTYIRSTPEKVWQAITEPEFTRQYWGGMVNISDWKKGSKWEHVAESKGSEVYLIGEVLDSVPPKLLVLSWVDPDNTAERSKVTFQIEQEDDMVRLNVIHGEFNPGSDMVGKVSNGWPRVLSSLKSYLETGRALSIFCK